MNFIDYSELIRQILEYSWASDEDYMEGYIPRFLAIFSCFSEDLWPEGRFLGCSGIVLVLLNENSIIFVALDVVNSKEESSLFVEVVNFSMSVEENPSVDCQVTFLDMHEKT